MRFKIFVKKVNTGVIDEEEYVKDITDPVQWGKETVDYFNSTLRPHESPREFIKAEILDEVEASPEHDWTKTNFITIIRGKRCWDTYRCEKCGATGKRFGLEEGIRPDKNKIKCRGKK